METIKLIGNPYKRVAELYNLGVNYVITNLTVDEVSTDSIIKETCNYLQQISDVNMEINSAVNYAFISSTINKLEQESLSEVLKHVKLTEKSVCLINSMLHISDDTDYPTTLKFVENIEQNILFAEISESEKQLPLLFAAVAKSSLEYWIAQVEKGVMSPWSAFVTTAGTTMQEAKWAWKEGGQGALAGMFNSSLVVVFANPLGTVAFTASVGCSIVASIATVFNRSFKN